MSPLPVMLLLVNPTVAAGNHLVAAAACMCPAADGTVVAAEVVLPYDMHCLPVVGAATSVVVVVVAIVASSVAVAAIVAVSVAAVIAGVFDVEVATLTSLSVDVLSTLLLCLAQICPSPFVFPLSTLVLLLFHHATFCAACACMHLRTCWPHHV